MNTAVLLTGGMSGAPTPRLSHVIPGEGRDSVAAVTSLGDDVFVLRDDSQQQVEVYDAASCTLQRHITVQGLGDSARGLAACAHYQCLYVSDDTFHNCSIHRVKLTGSSAVTKWYVAYNPKGLSVNRAHNVVVACKRADKLLEYTTHGYLVREICLQDDTEPWHAVQLSTGDYVVSLWKPDVVSVVGVDGQVRHSYGQSQTSDEGKMSGPTSLAVTKNGEILVADEYHNRILSVNSSLSSVHELALPVDGGIQQPRGLCLDGSRGRLYVGEGGGSYRVLVFDGVKP